MSTKIRKIEAHRLTISGLPEDTAYGPFLRSLRRSRRPVRDMVMQHSEKSHALNEVSLRNHRLRLRFLSFTRGHRPDVLDTTQFSLQATPLSPTQTNVEWTHALGGLQGNRYILLIERNIHGIWPSTIESYLQWAVNNFHMPTDSSSQIGNQAPVTISLEAVPGEEFISRMEALDRVTEATVRVVRPNPGWLDLETQMGRNAEESDAHKVDLTMKARRGNSLSRRSGILIWIREAFNRRHLDFAAVKGRRGNQIESFNTAKLGVNARLELEIDDHGQIIPDDAWTKLADMMDDIE